MVRGEESGENIEIWSAVGVVAAITNDQINLLSDSSTMIAELMRRGFPSEIISKTMDWLDKAAISGCLREFLSMWLPRSSYPRCMHPLEQTMLHPLLLRQVLRYRFSGLIAPEVAERLI